MNVIYFVEIPLQSANSYESDGAFSFSFALSV